MPPTKTVKIGKISQITSKNNRMIPEMSPVIPRNNPALIAKISGKSYLEALKQSSNFPLGAESVLAARQELENELKGYGSELAHYIDNPQISDICINKPGEIWIDRGAGMEKMPFSVTDQSSLRKLAFRLAAVSGKRLDDAAPIVDGILPGGIRLHALLPPLAKNTTISLRCPRKNGFSLAELVAKRMTTPEIAYLLQRIVTHELSGFISGATGSGKTTLLAALLELVPHNQRILCIEEVSELRPRHPHLVHLQERNPNIQGRGGIAMSELVRAAMRMRPDRIVLGECRGKEVQEVLSAMNTGHSGSWATVHANSVHDIPARLLALGMLAGVNEKALNAQVKAGTDVFIQVNKKVEAGKTIRWISEIGIPKSVKSTLQAEKALSIEPCGNIEIGPAWEKLAKKVKLPPNYFSQITTLKSIPQLKPMIKTIPISQD